MNGGGGAQEADKGMLFGGGQVVLQILQHLDRERFNKVLITRL